MQQNIAEYITIMLQNITIVAASNVLGEQDVLWGFDEGRIYDQVVIIIIIIIIIIIFTTVIIIIIIIIIFIIIRLLSLTSSGC